MKVSCVRVFSVAFVVFTLGMLQTAAQTASQFKLPANCTLPFDAIASKPDPFIECGNCGVVSADPSETAASKAAKVLQSQAKNNFCADASTVVDVDFTTLRQMQTNAKNSGLVVTDLTSRAKLHNFFKLNSQTVGEGTVVRLKAWVLDAHVSDCPSGESVNCEVAGFASNDLHIPLLDPAATAGRNQDECSSVTAEMSPHFRPAAWSNLDMKTPVKNVVRVTGPLFFDNAHEPCAGLTKTAQDKAPFRSSLWEVHPVYQFEVCANQDPAQCDITSTDAALWIPYDKWVSDAKNATAVQATGAKQRNAGECAHPAHTGMGGTPAQCPAASGGGNARRKSTGIQPDSGS